MIYCFISKCPLCNYAYVDDLHLYLKCHPSTSVFQTFRKLKPTTWFLISETLVENGLIIIQSIQGWTSTIRQRVKRKRSTKRLKHTGNMFKKNLQFKDDC